MKKKIIMRLKWQEWKNVVTWELEKNLINGNVCIKYMGIFIYVTMTNTHLTYLLSFSGTFNTSRNEIHVFTIFFLPIDSILLHFLKGKHRLDIISIGDGENLNSNERYFIICSKTCFMKSLPLNYMALFLKISFFKRIHWKNPTFLFNFY